LKIEYQHAEVMIVVLARDVRLRRDLAIRKQ
jgi:hypothetical protein